MQAGDRGTLAALYLPGSDLAKDALAKAWRRSLYWHAWAKERGIRWRGLTIRLRTPGIRFEGENRVRFFAVVQEKYRYAYPDRPLANVPFGIGTRHYDIVMERRGKRWYLAADDFVNRVQADDFARPTAAGFGAVVKTAPAVTPGAQRAIAYAEAHCGSAPGCGGGWHGRYNPDYQNFNGDGGDCTNFISQVLLAGGLRETREWNYDRDRTEGSSAWSNADGLAGFLAGSGRGSVFARGNYKAVTDPAPEKPRGAIGELRPGDLIGYEEHGRLVHTGVVVAFDPHGVPLTDTHTNDRHHTPWEFGWDGATRYWLWHVRYPKPESPPWPARRGTATSAEALG